MQRKSRTICFGARYAATIASQHCTWMLAGVA
jgi:hypothetical protein